MVFIFYSSKHFARNFQGGIQSSDCKEIYYLGVIDILQLYDAQKQRERFFKVHLLGKDKVDFFNLKILKFNFSMEFRCRSHWTIQSVL